MAHAPTDPERCVHCGCRLDDEPFTYSGHNFCCECMSEFCSWLLDGGSIENPETFDYVETGACDGSV